ncbi:MAG: hypothetical protein ACTSPD_12620 [Promethearchaeota archaeon]
MKISKFNSIQKLINLLSGFLEGKYKIYNEKYQKNAYIIHYYNEIIRNWNKLNFIIKKTIRSLNFEQIGDKRELAKLFYAVYRLLWENSKKSEIDSELKYESEKDLKIFQIIKKLKSFSWQKALAGKTFEEKLSISKAIPRFLIRHLIPVMDKTFLKKNIDAMNDYKKYKYSIYIPNERIKAKLLKEISNDPLKKTKLLLKDIDIPELYYILSIRAILKSELYRQGKIIILNKASLAVVKILSPKPNDFICDMCAAPGIKARLISFYTNNNSVIISSEFQKARAFEMKRIVSNKEFYKIHLINSDSIEFPVRSDLRFDKILLDAPCTGSGNLLLNPELKWKQNEKFLRQNIILQKKLLKTALNILKPSGILLYSTCSLYPEEGEMQIINILDKVKPLPLPKWISPSYIINGKEIPGTGRLFPATNNTQGFFIGKFKKKET